MPNVYTVAKCIVIDQFLERCKDSGFLPIRKSTMWWILDVQETLRRKSLRSVDNTAAYGADGSC